jgi:hypothetical protein
MIRAANNPFQSTPALVYPNLFKGNHPTLEALELEYPTPEAGSTANIIVLDGPNDLAVWDTDDSSWIIYPGAGVDLSGKEDSSNKAITMTGNTTSNVVFLAAKATYDWATGLFQPILTSINFGAFINGLTDKPVPVNADSISLVDSGDSNKQKKTSLTSFKAFLKTYFDTQYSKVVGYMTFVSPNGNPSTGATYYLADGNLGLFSTYSTINTNRRVSAMATGNLTKVHITVSAGLGASAPNNMTFVVENITQGTSQTITTSLTLSSGIVWINTSINLPVTINDHIALRWTMPAWGSLPTNVNVVANFTIET